MDVNIQDLKLGVHPIKGQPLGGCTWTLGLFNPEGHIRGGTQDGNQSHSNTADS